MVRKNTFRYSIRSTIILFFQKIHEKVGKHKAENTKILCEICDRLVRKMYFHRHLKLVHGNHPGIKICKFLD